MRHAADANLQRVSSHGVALTGKAWGKHAESTVEEVSGDALPALDARNPGRKRGSVSRRMDTNGCQSPHLHRLGPAALDRIPHLPSPPQSQASKRTLPGRCRLSQEGETKREQGRGRRLGGPRGEGKHVCHRGMGGGIGAGDSVAERIALAYVGRTAVSHGARIDTAVTRCCATGQFRLKRRPATSGTSVGGTT